MTMILTRIKEIAEKEGFEIWNIRRHGKLLKVTSNGVMGKYDFDKKMKGAKTVDRWKKERFAKMYPGLTCDALKADGKVAKGQTKLETVRRTYEE